MPLVEFVCPDCGNRIESLDKAEARCKCGKKMKKVLSAPAFRVYTKVR